MAKKYIGYACRYKGSCEHSKFCKIYATKISAEKKEKGCYRNPDNKTCGSCVHFIAAERKAMRDGQEVILLPPDYHCEIKPECMIIHEDGTNKTANYNYERDCKHYREIEDDFYIELNQKINI